MRRVVDALMRRFIMFGRLDILYSDGQRVTYQGRGAEPAAAMRLMTPRAERAMVINSGLAFGESYMDGEIAPLDCSLEELLSVLMLNINRTGHIVNRLEGATRYATRKWAQFNTLAGSRRNVAHHYDLNGRLYDLFLDPDRQYSCAYYARDDMTLEEAQVAKKHHIAAKLNLDRPGLRVLDIGCGWGGMALTLARDYGAQVTGITLSKEQFEVARARAREAGLGDRITIELRDYRDVRHQYDRIVSVGMFEHVGVGQFDRFFRAVRECLLPDGVALLHSIGRMDGPGSTNPWLDKYIFPGGYSPALSETIAAIERADLWVTDCEILRLHYAKTIAEWRRRFEARRDEVVEMYDARFYRMFDLYLVGAELSFRVQAHMNFQLQLTRSQTAVPLTRDYMVDRERAAPAQG
jgi:cyclopropane-fatty-acyl-phospholipid synthase